MKDETITDANEATPANPCQAAWEVKKEAMRAANRAQAVTVEGEPPAAGQDGVLGVSMLQANGLNWMPISFQIIPASNQAWTAQPFMFKLHWCDEAEEPNPENLPFAEDMTRL